MVADARCSNCRFYQPHDLTGKDERNACLVVCSEALEELELRNNSHGECRRGRPTIDGASLAGFWPLILDYEWCGEWMPGDPKAP